MRFTNTRCLLLIVVSFLAIACGEVVLPSATSLPTRPVTPLDGDWVGYTSPFRDAKLRLDRGRLYFREPFKLDHRVIPAGAAIAHSFRQTGPTTFQCDWADLHSFLLPEGSGKRFIPVSVEIGHERTLVFNVPLVASASETISFRSDGNQILIRADKPPLMVTSAPDATGGPRTELKPTIERVELESEFVEIPAGGVYRSLRRRTVEHVVDFRIDTAIHGELSVDALSWLKASVKAEIERSSGRTFKESETVEKEVILDGNKGSRYKITWYGNYIVGTVTTKTGDRPTSVPFRFMMSEGFSATPTS